MKKILVVDDDRDVLEGLQIMLQQEGYDTRIASEGDEAYYEARKVHPDLIIMDYLLSGTNGCILAQKLKGSADTRQIPILMISAHPDADKRSYEYGIDDFMAKPFEIDYFLSMIRRYTAN